MFVAELSSLHAVAARALNARGTVARSSGATADGAAAGRAPRHATRIRALIVSSLALVATVVATAGASPAYAASPSPARGESSTPTIPSSDVEATRKLLEARIRLARRRLAGLSRSSASIEALAQQLEGECPGILVGQPDTESLMFEEAPSLKGEPRAFGADEREHEQLGYLAYELTLAFDRARFAPYAAEALAFAKTLGSLTWTSPSINRLEHGEAAVLEAELDGPAPDVCADMRAWVESGYTRLTAATKAYGARAEPVDEALGFAVRGGALELLESGTDPKLKEDSEHLGHLLAESEQTLRNSTARIAGKLGLIEERVAAREEQPEGGSKQIARGRTATHGSYRIRLESAQETKHLDRRCAATLEVSESNPGPHGDRISTSGVCLRKANPKPVTVGCRLGGMIEVSGQLAPNARGARLTLSDGREIVSPVASVPAKLGGPFAYYFQMVQGPRPVPVSLTELGPGGDAIKTIRLPRSSGCKPSEPHRKPTTRAARPAPTVERFAEGTAPDGAPRFELSAEGSRTGGQFQLGIRLTEGIGSSLLIGGDRVNEYLTVPANTAAGAPPLDLKLATHCWAHHFALLVGLLRDPDDAVLATTAAGAVTLHAKSLPSRFGIEGATVVYGTLPEVPSAVTVRSPSGTTPFSEAAPHLREAREVCEGEAEP
jgi:hypothetical protein